MHVSVALSPFLGQLTLSKIQEASSLADRVLCITFGAPPTSLTSSNTAGESLHMECRAPAVPALFWNFILANVASDAGFSLTKRAKDVIQQRLSLADIMPAAMATCPASVASAMTWLQAVIEVQKVASSKSSDAEDLQDSIDALLAAGKALCLFCVIACITYMQ